MPNNIKMHIFMKGDMIQAVTIIFLPHIGEQA